MGKNAPRSTKIATGAIATVLWESISTERVLSVVRPKWYVIFNIKLEKDAIFFTDRKMSVLL